MDASQSVQPKDCSILLLHHFFSTTPALSRRTVSDPEFFAFSRIVPQSGCCSGTLEDEPSESQHPNNHHDHVAVRVPVSLFDPSDEMAPSPRAEHILSIFNLETRKSASIVDGDNDNASGRLLCEVVKIEETTEGSVNGALHGINMSLSKVQVVPPFVIKAILARSCSEPPLWDEELTDNLSVLENVARAIQKYASLSSNSAEICQKFGPVLQLLWAAKEHVAQTIIIEPLTCLRDEDPPNSEAHHLSMEMESIWQRPGREYLALGHVAQQIHKINASLMFSLEAAYNKEAKWAKRLNLMTQNILLFGSAMVPEQNSTGRILQSRMLPAHEPNRDYRLFLEEAADSFGSDQESDLSRMLQTTLRMTYRVDVPVNVDLTRIFTKGRFLSNTNDLSQIQSPYLGVFYLAPKSARSDDPSLLQACTSLDQSELLQHLRNIKGTLEFVFGTKSAPAKALQQWLSFLEDRPIDTNQLFEEDDKKLLPSKILSAMELRLQEFFRACAISSGVANIDYGLLDFRDQFKQIRDRSYSPRELPFLYDLHSQALTRRGIRSEILLTPMKRPHIEDDSKVVTPTSDGVQVTDNDLVNVACRSNEVESYSCEAEREECSPLKAKRTRREEEEDKIGESSKPKGLTNPHLVGDWKRKARHDRKAFYAAKASCPSLDGQRICYFYHVEGLCQLHDQCPFAGNIANLTTSRVAPWADGSTVFTEAVSQGSPNAVRI